MDFKIRAIGYEPLSITSEMPAGLLEYYIPGSKVMYTTGAFGECLLQLIELDGFSWLYSVFNIQEDVLFQISSFIPVLLCKIALKGNFEHDIKMIGNIQLKDSAFNIIYCSSLNNNFSLKKGRQYISLDIHYPRDFMLYVLNFFPSLEEFNNKLQSSKPALLVYNEVYIDASITDSIYKLIHSPYALNVRKFHLDIIKDLLFKILKQASQLFTYSKKFSINHVEAIHEAKEFIDSNLPDHFSIFQIARRVGINEQKLKKGFREIFGKGLYAYLQEEVLKIAKIEIEETNKSVKEIAFHAGYKSANNFSAAFRKKFGISPLGWRKKYDSSR